MTDEREGYRYYLEAPGGAGPPAAQPKDEGFLARSWRTFGGST